VHHRTIQIDHQPDATIFSVYYPDVYLQLNMFRVFSRPSSRAATAVVELLMMGGRTPETCWAANKRQDNKLKNCCIWLVIYFNCKVLNFENTYAVIY